MQTHTTPTKPTSLPSCHAPRRPVRFVTHPHTNTSVNFTNKFYLVDATGTVEPCEVTHVKNEDQHTYWKKKFGDKSVVIAESATNQVIDSNFKVLSWNEL